MRELAKKQETTAPKPEPPREEAPKPAVVQPQPIDANFLQHAETTLVELLTDPASEQQRIQIYIAPTDLDRLKLVVAILAAIPTLRQELILRAPIHMDRAAFHFEFAKELWRRAGNRILEDIHRAYRTNRVFRKKVDIAQGRKPEEDEKE